MKTKNTLLFVCFVAYLHLFYQQSAGINLLIFSILLVTSSIIIQPQRLKNVPWMIVASGAIISGIGLVLHANTLSVIANLISVLILGGLNFYKEFSLVLALLNSVLSYFVKPFTSLLTFAQDLVQGEKNDDTRKTGFLHVNNLLKVILPVLIVLVFIAMYSRSNPLFASFLEQSLQGISAEFIAFSIAGFVAVYVYFNPYLFSEFQNFEARNGNVLSGFNPEERTIFRTTENEFSAAKLTFLLLNILIISVNVLDLQYALDTNKVYVKHTTLIHESVNNSISSVLVAIFVILYFFRGNLNFITQNRTLKRLALLWVVQNILLLGSCFYKNYDYIYAHGLTHKRIGVYAYILVVLIGLILTGHKILSKKSNMFLFRSNSWFIYLLLVISTCFPWNKIILNYNLTYHPKTADKYYLEYLEIDALPHLITQSYSKTLDCEQQRNECDFQAKVMRLEADFIQDFTNQSWQSWTWNDQLVYNEIQGIKMSHKK